jgi:hypothetical protein
MLNVKIIAFLKGARNQRPSRFLAFGRSIQRILEISEFVFSRQENAETRTQFEYFG